MHGKKPRPVIANQNIAHKKPGAAYEYHYFRKYTGATFKIEYKGIGNIGNSGYCHHPGNNPHVFIICHSSLVAEV